MVISIGIYALKLFLFFRIECTAGTKNERSVSGTLRMECYLPKWILKFQVYEWHVHLYLQLINNYLVDIHLIHPFIVMIFSLSERHILFHRRKKPHCCKISNRMLKTKKSCNVWYTIYPFPSLYQCSYTIPLIGYTCYL